MKIERMQLPPIYTREKLKDQVQREIASEIVGSVDPDADKREEFHQSQFDNLDNQEKEDSGEKSAEQTGDRNSGLNIVV